MTIYETLPKVEIPGVGGVVAYIDAPIEFTADSDEFGNLTAGYETPMSETDYTSLLQKTPPGWAIAFGILRGQGII